MKNFKRIFIATFIALLGIGLFYFKMPLSLTNPEQFVRKREGLQRLIINAKEMSRIWTEGEDSREWGLVKNLCLNKYQITDSFDESLLRCHPMIIECANQFLTKKDFSIIKSSYLYPNYLFTLEDKATHETLEIGLTDDCHELYLEQNTYAYGEAPKGKKSEDFNFDTFNRHIYFDQHLVTNGEINEWIKYDDKKNTEGLKTESQGNKLFLAATHLNLKQMQNYCSFKGKQLTLAHIYDAATFFTNDNHRSPYYWTKKRLDQKFNCDLVFSEECLREKKWRLNSTAPTWSGLNDSLGGVMEAVRNPIEVELNLKASSMYFPRNSRWHQLGIRAHWDGDGNNLSNFNFFEIAPTGIENFYHVGFRCMREANL